MKKHITMILLIAMCCFLSFQGCSPAKNEEKLLEDLTASNDLVLPHGAKVTELSVQKRITKKDKEFDTFFVQISIDGPEALQTRTYIMNYTLNNEGWMLDSLVPNEEGKAWYTQAKKAPTEAIVLDQLIAFSNASIQEYYDFTYGNLFSNGPMYFEEGTYKTSILNEQIEDDTFSCTVSTVREFEYVASHEDIRITMVMDPFTYKWELVSAESVSLSAEWFVATSWSNEEYAVGFSLTNIQENGMYLGDAFVWSNYNSYNLAETELYLSAPSFIQIDPAVTTISRDIFQGRFYADVIFWPNGMWLRDADGEIEEFYGKIESYHVFWESSEKYTEVAENTIVALWKNYDVDAFLSMLHPSALVQYAEIMSRMDETDLENVPTLDSYAINHIEIYSDYSPNRFDDWDKWTSVKQIIENLRGQGYRVDAIGIVDFVMSYDNQTTTGIMILAEDDEDIYVLGFD